MDVGDDIGEVTLDVAFGGNFYGILPVTARGLELVPSQASKLIERGLAVVQAIDEQIAPIHPDDDRIRGVEHLILTAPGRDGAAARSATVIHPGWIDRSACGTGTSARMAQVHANGQLDLDTPFVHESLIGSRFTGRLVEETTVGGAAAGSCTPTAIPTSRSSGSISSPRTCATTTAGPRSASSAGRCAGGEPRSQRGTRRRSATAPPRAAMVS